MNGRILTDKATLQWATQQAVQPLVDRIRGLEVERDDWKKQSQDWRQLYMDTKDLLADVRKLASASSES